jgi:hypothetical protein
MIELQRMLFNDPARMHKPICDYVPDRVVREDEDESNQLMDSLQWLEKVHSTTSKKISVNLATIIKDTNTEENTKGLVFKVAGATVPVDANLLTAVDAETPGRLGGNNKGLLVPWGAEGILKRAGRDIDLDEGKTTRKRHNADDDPASNPKRVKRATQ